MHVSCCTFALLRILQCQNPDQSTRSLQEPAQWQAKFSTIRFAISKFYCRGVSHEKKKNSVFGQISSLTPISPPPSKAQILFLLSSRRLWLYNRVTEGLGCKLLPAPTLWEQGCGHSGDNTQGGLRSCMQCKKLEGKKEALVALLGESSYVPFSCPKKLRVTYLVAPYG